MTTQLYQQKPAPDALPAGLRWLTVAIGALVVVLAALPVSMTLDRDGTRESILRNRPSLEGDSLEFALNATLGYTAAAHALYAVVAVWLTVKVLRGRTWARVTLTVAMVLASINSLDSAQAGPEYYTAVIAGDVLHVLVIALLWLPRPVRQFFAARPHSAKTPTTISGSLQPDRF
jgi:hypothetical protein